MSAHTELGTFGEAYVADKLATIAPVERSPCADLRWLGLDIEVKTARASTSGECRRPRWQFCLERAGHTTQRGDVVILVLQETRCCYVIPAAALQGRRKLSISPRPGKFTCYAEAWDVLADLLEGMRAPATSD